MKSMIPPTCMDASESSATYRRMRFDDDDEGVSEIIGVVMLLAMVLSILGVVLVALKPYVDDFDDNKNWTSAQVLTEQLQERIDIVGSAPNGTGVAFSLPLVTSVLRSLDLVETWNIQADLYGDDRIGVKLLNATGMEITSQNETVASISVQNDGDTNSYNITDPGSSHTIDTNRTFGDELVVDVLDTEGNIIHRMVQIRISGLQMDTDMNTGIHNIAMANGGLITRMPNEAWSIEKFPQLDSDETFSGQNRVSLMLTDVKATGSLSSGKSSTLEIISKGPLTLFDGEARNLRFTCDNQIHDNINPEYTEFWTGDYRIHQATGDASSYQGFGPWGKSSGVDGIGFFPGEEPILLEIVMKRVEVD